MTFNCPAAFSCIPLHFTIHNDIFVVQPLTEICRYMDAYRAGATGSNVLQKTQELKKSHCVPLVIDQPARVPYDMSRGERVLRMSQWRVKRSYLTRKVLPKRSVSWGIKTTKEGGLLERVTCSESEPGKLHEPISSRVSAESSTLTSSWKTIGGRRPWQRSGEMQRW